METSFSLPAPDGKRIYGVAHSNKESDAAVILVHGLTGHMNEYLHLAFARSIARTGLAVLRFNQYDDGEQARRFHESTIRLHVADTKCVMQYARALGFKKLVLVGHSLGAPVAIFAADSETNGLVLWDPSDAPSEKIQQWNTFDEMLQISYLDWDKHILLGEDWINDAKSFPDPFEHLRTLTLPVKVIAAEHGGLIPTCERYCRVLAGQHEVSVIPRAGHNFVEEGLTELLTTETETWLRQILQIGTPVDK